MSKKLITLDSAVSTAEVAKIMDKNNVSCVVLTKNEKLHGIVTERDLLSKVIASNKKPTELTANEIMTSPVTLVSSLTPVDEVAQKMRDKKIRRVLVADNEQPLGIITVTDFVKHLHTILSDSNDYKTEVYQNLFEDYEHWNF
ncbi:MAG TPA: CBS domain-containing protein [Nitrosopumilaceae archaeon]|nr:CBS domain-containing protein [Nitrosopumilaceae archaeon]